MQKGKQWIEIVGEGPHIWPEAYIWKTLGRRGHIWAEGHSRRGTFEGGLDWRCASPGARAGARGALEQGKQGEAFGP